MVFERSLSVLMMITHRVLLVQNEMRPWAHPLGVAPEPQKVSEKHFEGQRTDLQLLSIRMPGHPANVLLYQSPKGISL